MPKKGTMAQISRPFQIAFLAVVLLAGVWLFALRGHSASTSGSGASAVAPAPARPVQSPAGNSSAGGNAGAPSTVYKGAAPGVGGLTRAIAKAHGAVATSQQNAKELTEKSAQASSSAAAGTASTPATSVPSAVASKPGATPAKPTLAPSVKSPSAHAHPIASLQPAIESELKAGSIVVLLVWNPKGTEDAIVHNDLLALAALHRRYAHVRAPKEVTKGLTLELEQPIATHSATPGQVASFGSFAKDVQILSTPTVLIVNKSGQVRTLTGAPGVLSIEQATDEARHS
jgi:hypothetical protein